MFYREKQNKSGSISIQVLEKTGRSNRLVKTIGNSKDSYELEILRKKAQQYIDEYSGQQVFDFEAHDQSWADAAFNQIKDVRLLGPELLLGALFNQIGFNQVKDDLFRDLVISRIVYPSSKLKTVRYLKEYRGAEYKVHQVYRYMDKLHRSYKDQVEQISFQHTLGVLKEKMSIVFYDVTTIYFEAEQEDDLRIAGFSKEGKHKHPQILLGLLVSVGGYPLAYEIFEGNKYEGHTMLPVINAFKEKFDLGKLIVIADSGLMTKNNVLELIENDYEFILGARIKTESIAIKEQILDLSLKDGASQLIEKENGLKLIISYSEKRAKKDAYNRERGLKKLEKSLAKGKLTKQNINNRGYNKYLRMDGQIKISIDYERYHNDTRWDGLKGYISNAKLSPEELIGSYKELWKIEKAFRISKTDLRIRPIYHRLKMRIESHICISFAAYKVYRELERQLADNKSVISIERAIEIMKNIYGITIQHPISKHSVTKIFTNNNDQQYLLNLFNVDLG